MKLKICGIRNKEMIDFCQENQVDFCGFNFVPTSKRKINTDFVVPKNFKPKKVGIFQNQTFDEISEILNKFQLDIIQLHGNEDAIFLQKIKKIFPRLKTWKALSVNNLDTIKLQDYCQNSDIVLFDGDIPGSGETIKKENAIQLQKLLEYCEKLNFPYIIAGGINNENITKFKQKYKNAYALDTASGVEENGKFDKTVAQKLINNFRY